VAGGKKNLRLVVEQHRPERIFLQAVAVDGDEDGPGSEDHLPDGFLSAPAPAVVSIVWRKAPTEMPSHLLRFLRCFLDSSPVEVLDVARLSDER